MKKLISVGNHLTPYLLVACVLLAGILSVESHNMIQMQNSSSPGALSMVDKATRDSFIPPGIATFSEITERPLFMEGREPPPEPKAEPVAATRPVPLRLLLEGVAITPVAEIAVVRDLSSNKILQLAKGMKHQGWELTSITATSVTFERGDQSQVIILKTEENNRRR